VDAGTGFVDAQIAPDQTLDGELLRAQGLSKSYGHVRALSGVDLSVHRGETVAVLGHNGSGKSTLMRILSGRTQPDTGTATIAGEDVGGSHTPLRARQLGVRIVDQEFPLCLTLTVRENLVVKHPRISSRRSRKQGEETFVALLDDVFPGSEITLGAEVQDLSVAQRQMLDIALAICVATPSEKLNLLLLDEATSALPEARRQQLFAYLRMLRDRGVGIVLISHRLEEVIEHADRVEVLRDGQRVGSLASPELSRSGLIDLMGGVEAHSDATRPLRAAPRAASPGPSARPDAADAEPICIINDYTDGRLLHVSVSINPSEVVGIGGLEGQGQRELLTTLFDAGRGRKRRGIRMSTSVAYVSGDRNGEGVFPLWSVARNISIGALKSTSKLGFVQRVKEQELAKSWIEHLRIRTAGADSLITDLSGGSQQKALIARVLASGARLILLDDPTRGVDVGTKAEIYELLRSAVDEGRSFVWYSTDNAEFQECHRVLVMRAGTVVRELRVDDASERELVSASFAGADERDHQAGER
jgi:ribose transport system ATP-binding protein